MKSLRILASLMLASVLAFSAAPAPALISTDSQHEPKKEKSKDDSKKEKDSKKDKYDKAVDDLDKALESDKKKSKEDKSDSKKEKDSKSDKDDSKKEDYKPSGDEDYEGTYRGESGFQSTGSGRSSGYEIALKLEKAKKGPLYTVGGAIRYTPSSEDSSDPELYSVQGSFSPRTGKLRATFKPKSENAKGKGEVDGEYKDGSFTVTLGGIVRFKEVTKQ